MRETRVPVYASIAFVEAMSLMTHGYMHISLGHAYFTV